MKIPQTIVIRRQRARHRIGCRPGILFGGWYDRVVADRDGGLPLSPVGDFLDDRASIRLEHPELRGPVVLVAQEDDENTVADRLYSAPPSLQLRIAALDALHEAVLDLQIDPLRSTSRLQGRQVVPGGNRPHLQDVEGRGFGFSAHGFLRGHRQRRPRKRSDRKKKEGTEGTW